MRRTCLSPGIISICKTTDITLILILTVARALTWKLHAGGDGHHPWSCLQYQNHTIIAIMYLFCFPDALELLSEARLSYILSFTFNPRDYVHQRWSSKPKLILHHHSYVRGTLEPSSITFQQ